MTPIAIHVGSSVTAKTTIPVVSPTPIHCPVLPALKEFFDLLSTFTLQFYFVILINSSNLKLLKVISFNFYFVRLSCEEIFKNVVWCSDCGEISQVSQYRPLYKNKS